MRIGPGLGAGVLAAGLALAAGAQAALTVTFSGSASWTYGDQGTWDYAWSVEAPIDAIATTAFLDWSDGLPAGVTAAFTATRTTGSGSTAVARDVIGLAYTLEPGGTCPIGETSVVASPGAVCGQVLLAPLPGTPAFGDAVNRMTIRDMTLVLFDLGTAGDPLTVTSIALAYQTPLPAAVESPPYAGTLSFRGTALTPGLVPPEFEPPGGLPPPPFGGTPGGQVPPEFLPPTSVPEPATLGLLGLGLLGLAALRRRAGR